MKTCPRCSASFPDDYAVCPKDSSPLIDTSFWQVDTVIRGKYKILGKIGEGGMATVYKAHHQMLDELRALKVIKPELARDEQFVQRFKNEAIITRKLRHPNAVRVDDLDLAEDGRPFISMELVEGESLKSAIQREGSLEVSRTLDVALQVCQALQAAHELGLIHRDIKPDNIFLVPRPGSTSLAKVLDFGIARLKESAPDSGLGAMTLTATGVAIGTPEYMSPEQSMGKRSEQLDGRSDLYSLGVVMYRMLTGELPFKADTTVEMILHHIQTLPTPPQALKPRLRIPDGVSSLVMTALEKDRERRFPSAAAMAEAIRNAQAAIAPAGLAGSIVAGYTPTVVTPTPSTVAKPMPQPAVIPGVGQSQAPSARVTPPVRSAPAPPARRLSPSPTKPKGPWRLRILWATLVFVLVAALASNLRLRKQAQTPPVIVQQISQPAATPPTTPSVAAASTTPPTAAPTVATPSTAAPTVTPTAASPSTTPPTIVPTEPTASTAGETLTPTAPPAALVPSPQPSQTPTAAPAKLRPVFSSVRPREPASPHEASQTLGPQTRGGQESVQRNVPEPSVGVTPSEKQQVRQLSQDAQELYDEEKFGMAAQKYRQILKIDPDNRYAQASLVKSLNGMGQKLFRSGAYQRAARVYRQVLEISPDNKVAHQGLDECLERIRENRRR